MIAFYDEILLAIYLETTNAYIIKKIIIYYREKYQRDYQAN